MKRALLVLAVALLYVLHQDLWFWRTARPLVFGFLPIGLFYHACFSVAASLVLWLLVRHAWPAHLESGDATAAADDGGFRGVASAPGDDRAKCPPEIKDEAEKRPPGQ